MVIFYCSDINKVHQQNSQCVNSDEQEGTNSHNADTKESNKTVNSKQNTSNARKVKIITLHRVNCVILRSSSFYAQGKVLYILNFLFSGNQKQIWKQSKQTLLILYEFLFYNTFEVI